MWTVGSETCLREDFFYIVFPSHTSQLRSSFKRLDALPTQKKKKSSINSLNFALMLRKRSNLCSIHRPHMSLFVFSWFVFFSFALTISVASQFIIYLFFPGLQFIL